LRLTIEVGDEEIKGVVLVNSSC